MQYEGRAPRAATNEHHRGSRRGERSTSSSSDDPDADPEPHRVCECGCGALLDHLRSHARFLDGAHRMRALRRSEAERDALILHPIAASAITRPCTKTHDNLGLGDLFQHKAVLRSDLAPDGVDEAQLHEWERACAEDMRKARPVQVKTFKC